MTGHAVAKAPAAFNNIHLSAILPPRDAGAILMREMGIFQNRSWKEGKPMPTIKWVGFQKWGKDNPDVPIPENAVPMDLPENLFKKSVPFGVFPMLLCFTALIGKRLYYGEFPLILFLTIPISWKIPAAIFWPSATTGMISPSPDYRDIWNFGKTVPRGASVQGSNKGWYWYQKEDSCLR